MHTIDRLTDKDRREVTTVWTTDVRVNEGTYDAGTVQVALTTSHDKRRKRFETRINREVRIDAGFIRRSFVVYAAPTADSGITVATEPTERFNAKRAAALHDFVLTNIALLLDSETRSPDVARELAELIGREVVAA
jgi:hypothetical protein